MAEFTSLFSKKASIPTGESFSKALNKSKKMTDEYLSTSDGMSAAQQELLDHALAKNDKNLLNAQNDVIKNPEFYRERMYGGTQVGRPGADKVDWTHPVFSKGVYRMNYLKAMLESSKTVDTSGTSKAALTITGTVAGVAVSEEADAGVISSITNSIVTSTAGATERYSRFSQDEIKGAEAEIARYEKLKKSLDGPILKEEDDAFFKDFTDVERILFLSEQEANTDSVYIAAYKKNLVDTWSTRLEHQIDDEDEDDLEWMEFGRDEWYKENLAEFSFTGEDETDINKGNGIFHLKKFWDSLEEHELPNSREDAMALTARYTDEFALSKRIYSKDSGLFLDSEWEAMLRGFHADIVSSVLSPQELALAIATFGSSKIYTISSKMMQARLAFNRASKAKKAIMGVTGTAILGSGTALTMEETRQALKGLELDNKETMALIGGLFGVGTYGVSKTIEIAKDFFMSLTKKEQTQVIEELGKKVSDLQEEVKEIDGTKTLKREDDEPTYDELEQKILDVGYDDLDTVVQQGPRLDRSGIAMGASQTLNPSPILRAYDLGIKSVYNVLDKIRASTNTLIGRDGKPVVQQGATSDAIYRKKYVGTHNKLVANLRSLMKQSKMKRADFNLALDTAVKKQTALHREKSVAVSVLKDFIKVRKEALKETNDPREVYRLNTIISKYERKLETAQGRIVDTLSSGNKHIDDAVSEVQNYYQVYNREIYALDRRDLLKKQGDELDRVAERDGDMDALMTKHDEQLQELDDFYKDKHLGYSPRYWNQEALENDPQAAEKLTKALLKSSYARALKVNNPKDYKEFIKEIPTIVSNMRRKIKDSDMENNLRDISASRVGGGGDKSSGKSEIGRRIDVDELMVQDLVQTDWTTVTQAYNHDLGHKLAFREALGVKDWKEFDEVYMTGIKDDLSRSNLGAEQRRRAEEDIKTVVEEALGTRGLIKKDNSVQRIKRVFLDTTNAIFSPGFGLTTIAEAGPVLSNGGRDIIRQIWPSIKQVASEYKKKGYDPDSMDALKGYGIGAGIQNSLVASRLEDGTFYAFNKRATFDRRWSEGAKKVSNIGYHGGGFHGITSFYKYASAGAFQAKVHRIGTRLADGGKPLSKSEEKYFARMGLDTDTLIDISRQPFKDKDGNQNYNMSGWDDDVQERVWDSMSRATNESVLEPSGYDMPRITSGGDDIGAVSSMFLQYNRYPLAAYNMYIKNGMSDRDAKILASSATSFSILAATLYAQQESEVAMGIRTDENRRYIHDDDGNLTSDGMMQLGIDTFGKMPQSTLLPRMISTSLAVTGQEQLGPDGFTLTPGQTTEGVALSTLGRIWKTSLEAFEEEEAPVALLNITPVARHPFLSGFIDYTVDKYE